MRLLRYIFARAGITFALFAGPSLSQAFDTTAPSIGEIFSITDCEGVAQTGTLATTTGSPNIQFSVQDSTSGLRIGRTVHIGGQNGISSTVLLLKFDSSPGYTTDSSTFANVVTNMGSTQVGGGAGPGSTFNEIARFPAGTPALQINASPSLNSTTSQLTIQAWINPTDFSADRPIFEWNDGISSGTQLWQLTGGALFANLIDTTAVHHIVQSGAGVLTAGTWQLVTLTYVGNVATLYVNDVRIASQAFSGNVYFLRTGFNAFVGRRPASPAVSFLGDIDEVRVLNTPIGSDTVEGDFYSGKFQVSSVSASGPFFRSDLLEGTSYFPNAANGATALSTVARSTVPFLNSGSNNFLRLVFQDMAGNTEIRTLPIQVNISAPTVPQNLTGTPQNASSDTTRVLWTWSKPSRVCLSPGLGPPSYNVYYATTSSPARAAGIITPLQFLEIGLSTNTLYGRRVTALDAYGESSLSPPTSAYTLAAPSTGFVFTNISTGGFTVFWSSNGNPGYTRWELSLSSAANFSSEVSTPIAISDDYTANSLSVTGLLSATTYYLRVRAQNGRSLDSFGTQFTNFLSSSVQTLPTSPASLSAAAQGTSSILWSWSAVTSATGYTLISSTGGVLFDGLALSFLQTGLSTNTNYGAQVRANNLSGSSLLSNTVFAFTLAAVPSQTTVTSVSSASISLSWSANTNPLGTIYDVVIATDPGFQGSTTTQSAALTSLVVTGLLPGTTYSLHVRARNGNGLTTAFDATVTTRTITLSSVSSVPTPPTPYQTTNGTVGLWHFDEGGGTTTLDSSGFSNHGVLTCLFVGCSTPTFTSGQVGLGTAVQYTGIQNTLCSIASRPSLEFGGSLSLEAWVYPTVLAQTSGAGIVAKGGGTQGSTFGLDILSGQWRFFVNDGAGASRTVVSTQSIKTQWTHVTGVYDEATGSLRIYIDGILSNSAAFAPFARGNNAHEVSIGNRRSGSGAGGPYDLGTIGIIDEVRLLNRALSAQEVAADFASARPASLSLPSPNQNTCLIIPPDALRSAGSIIVSSDPTHRPILTSRQVVLDALSSPPTGQTLIPGSLIEIIAEVGGLPFTSNFGSSITVCQAYPDADGNLLVDGTFPPIPVDGLALYTLNPSVIRWERLSSSVDTANKRVLGQSSHFSIFALFGPTGIKLDLNTVRIYPVPWKPGSSGRFDSVTFAGKKGLAIDNLPNSGFIRIFTLAGEMVIELPFTSTDVGTVIWDGKNHAGRNVASGVYFAYVKSSDGTSAVLKFAIER